MRRPANVLRQYLFLKDKQKQEMDKLYAAAVQAGKFVPYIETFDIHSKDGYNGQQHAHDLLVQFELDEDSRERLESRWTCRWSTRWNLTTGSKSARRRSLWQCVCGYDHEARQISFESSAQSKQIQNKCKTEWDRRVSYDNTGCLAHLEVTEDTTLGVVLKIAGIKDHNNACKKSLMQRTPYVPLHIHVYEVSLQQLCMGASLSIIHKTNDLYISRQAYRGMKSWDPKLANIRYNLMRQDHPTLYRKFCRLNGIDITRKPHENIDSWLNCNSPLYQPNIEKAVFHYEPRTKVNDRFELGIATEEMDKASWKYGHGKQLLFDGTFGVCTSKVLLFIVMGLTEDNKGIPLAFFVFSARSGAQASHASYDTDILEKFLKRWREHLEEKRKPFEPRVVITDNDTRERSALLNTWPTVILLLCKFHLRQSWKNYRTKLFGGMRKLEKKSDFWIEHVNDRLRSLEVRYVVQVPWKI